MANANRTIEVRWHGRRGQGARARLQYWRGSFWGRKVCPGVSGVRCRTSGAPMRAYNRVFRQPNTPPLQRAESI